MRQAKDLVCLGLMSKARYSVITYPMENIANKVVNNSVDGLNVVRTFYEEQVTHFVIRAKLNYSCTMNIHYSWSSQFCMDNIFQLGLEQ